SPMPGRHSGAPFPQRSTRTRTRTTPARTRQPASELPGGPATSAAPVSPHGGPGRLHVYGAAAVPPGPSVARTVCRPDRQRRPRLRRAASDRRVGAAARSCRLVPARPGHLATPPPHRCPRCSPCADGAVVAEAVRRRMDENDVDGISATGGDGTLYTANRLFEAGIPVVGVPKTVDNDLDATDYTFGFNTAVEVATEALDRL